MEELQLEQLKSLHCGTPIDVTFHCRSSRKTGLFWIDYNGRLVLYHYLQPGETFEVSTFETHPWVFIDADSKDYLVANRKDQVYFPSEEKNYIYIDLPGKSFFQLAVFSAI